MSDVAIVSTLLAYAAVLLVGLLGLFAAGWVSINEINCCDCSR